MNAPEPPRQAPPERRQSAASPCVNVCRMNAAAGLCEGCLRTLSEITAWGSMPEADRQQLWVQLRRRRAVLEGGLAALAVEADPRDQPQPGPASPVKSGGSSKLGGHNTGPAQ